MRTKGIFCLEGLWDSDLKKRSSVRPILEILEQREGIPYIFHDCATPQELEYFIRRFALAQYSRYPILYLAFHGTEGVIHMGDGSKVELDDLANWFPGTRRSVIIFASCSTVNIHKAYLKRFMKGTGAIAVCGYKNEADWMTATAFELLLLSTLQQNEFSGKGIRAIVRKTTAEGRRFKDLGFRIVSA